MAPHDDLRLPPPCPFRRAGMGRHGRLMDHTGVIHRVDATTTSPVSRSLPGFPTAIPSMCTVPSTFSPD